MQLKQVDIFYNDNTPALFRDLFVPLQSLFSSYLFEEWSLSREWVNGPHFRLLLNHNDFFYSEEMLQKALELIEHYLTQHASEALDEAAYRVKQEKLMAIEKQVMDPTLVLPNNSVKVTDKPVQELAAKYENMPQWRSVFHANCRIRPLLLSLRADADTNEEQSKQLFDLMMLLATVYQPKVNPEADSGEYNGFLSYFSNFTFWHHSMPHEHAGKIKANFEQKYQQEHNKYANWMDCLRSRVEDKDISASQYGQWLKQQFRQFTQMACEDVIHHRSPFPKEQLADMSKVSSFHREHFYTKDGKGSGFPTDFSSYRWLLNIVYRFFPLLNFTPMDRQYFNYSLSRFELENRDQVYGLRDALYQV